MKKIIERIEKETVHYCDFCKPETLSQHQCKMCHKDMCKECCAAIDYRYSDDYPDYYCESCNKIRNPYLLQISKHQGKIDEILDELDMQSEEIRKRNKNEKKNMQRMQ